MKIKVKTTSAFLDSLTVNDKEKVIKLTKDGYFSFTDKEDLPILRQLALRVDGMKIECFVKK